MHLESNLSTLMGKHRYTIQDVHERTGLSRNTISSLYNDKATRIDFDTIARLCKLFACDINELLSLAQQSNDASPKQTKENVL